MKEKSVIYKVLFCLSIGGFLSSCAINIDSPSSGDNSTPEISVPPSTGTPSQGEPSVEVLSTPSISPSTPSIPLQEVLWEGMEEKEIALGEYFDAFENVHVKYQEEDLTKQILIKGFVPYGQIGTYTLTYEVEVEQQVFRKERKISVVDKPLQRKQCEKEISSGTTQKKEGSYRYGNGADLGFAPPAANYIEEELKNNPIPTTSWWTTMLTANYGNGNGIYTNPLRSSFASNGVEVTDVGEGFSEFNLGGDYALNSSQFSITYNHLRVKADSLQNEYQTKVIGYSDNSTQISMRNDANGIDEMVVTYVQGSPYIFFETAQKDASIRLTNGAIQPYEFYDLSGNRIQNSFTGNALIIKLPGIHVGYQVEPPTTPGGSKLGAPIHEDRYYLVNAPEGSKFTMQNETHGSRDYLDLVHLSMAKGNYFSICPIKDLSEASFYHEHGYSFIRTANTYYEVDHTNNLVKTTFVDRYQNMQNDDAKPALALMPHQYKYSSVPLTSYTYRTVRGTLKVYEGNQFETEQSFYGMLPTNTLPLGDAFSKADMKRYLSSLNSRTEQYVNNNGPYWDSKYFYPLSQGIVFADQLGENELKNTFIQKAEKSIADWFTYSGSQDRKYLYYHPSYGTRCYSNNDFSTTTELNDHHFTHGYLMYAFSVISMYDSAFYEKYSEVAEDLLFDYMNPHRESEMYPYFRTFDAWAGHSWANGFGFFGDGNNQESSGEALNSWVGGYLFGLQKQDQTIIDAAIYGYTTELNAIKQYVFNYDGDTFSEIYAKEAGICAILWGGKNTDATWFGNNPSFVYGIHYLPIGEYVSGYAVGEEEHETLRGIYQKFEQRKSVYTGKKDTWMANMLSVESLFDAESARKKFNENQLLNDDYPSDLSSAYWMIYSNQSLGSRVGDVVVDHSAVGFDVYQKGSSYQVQLWNPTNVEQKVKVKKDGKLLKEVLVPARSFICEKI